MKRVHEQRNRKRAAHALEIIEENGKYYITTCGRIERPVPHKGGVSIASLEWKQP